MNRPSVSGRFSDSPGRIRTGKFSRRALREAPLQCLGIAYSFNFFSAFNKFCAAKPVNTPVTTPEAARMGA